MCSVRNLVLKFDYEILHNAAEAILLGFQHYLVMLGTTVIIPTALVTQMVGNNIRLHQFTKFCCFGLSLSIFFIENQSVD